jgi:hypothetical protein
LAAWGLPPDAFEGLENDEEHCEVWEENWDTVMVFLACQTQWRKEIPAMAGQVLWHGLDYSGVEVVIRLKGFKGKKAEEIFEGIQVMEVAAMPLLNKPKK